jgi:hypothetical protein
VVTSYRVAADAPADPLEVDTDLARSQYLKRRLVIHAITSVFTFGLSRLGH